MPVRTTRSARPRRAWLGSTLVVLVGVVVLAGAAMSAGPVAADETTEPPAFEVEIVDPLWSGRIADALLASGQGMTQNPFSVIVQFRADAASWEVDGLLAEIDGRIVAEHGAGSAARVHVVETLVGVDVALEVLGGSPIVVRAGADEVIEPTFWEWGRHLSLDTYTQWQWGLDAGAGIDVVPAWAEATGAATVLVGVIDGGIDFDNPDLADMIWTNPGEIAGNGIDDDANGYIDDVHGWDFVGDDNDPSAENYHGPHVSAIIAAERDDRVGIAGVAANVRIVPLRYSNASGWGFSSDSIAALEYALDNGITITNNSYGGNRQWWTETLLTNHPDHLLVASAGNDAEDDTNPSYPAGYDLPNVLSVTSNEFTGEFSSWAARGLVTVDITAPGGSIHSATEIGSYVTATGTSMAAPHATGVAAMMRGLNPELTPAEIIDRILDTSRWHHQSAIDAVRSGGHLDAGRAVRAAQPDAPTVQLSAAPVTVVRGSVLSLSATALGVGGDLGASIEWYAESADGTLDGSLVGTGGELDLVIPASGRVRVRAEVTDGDGRWGIDTVIVTTVDAPSAPLDVAVVAADGQIDVAWSEPVDAGSAPITSYVATASPGGASCTATTTACTIDGLTNGVTYDVTVVARSAVATGPESAPSLPVTPAGLPSPPTSLSAVLDDGTLDVSWAAPVDPGGLAVERYVVTVAPAGLDCVVAADVTSCRFTGLDGARQIVTVRAHNAVGAGESAQTTVGSAIGGGDRCSGVATSSFVDVPSTSFASSDVACLVELGVTTGTSATTFSPSAFVTREQMAAFLARMYRELTWEPCDTVGSTFVDLAPTSYAAADVECLRGLGITNGTSATTYSPGAAVTREQMGAFLARMYREITGEPCAPSESSFVDVSATSFARVDVECLRVLGITNGTSATTYSPAALVTREQMAAFLGRLYRAIAT